MARREGSTRRQPANRRRERLALKFRAVVFSELDYCGQVRAVANAKLLIGIHGQGLSNSIFLHPRAVLVELITPKAKTVAGFGNQPLAEVLGMHFIGARLAEGPEREECGILNWKVNPNCPSYVNVSKLEAVLARAQLSLS